MIGCVWDYDQGIFFPRGFLDPTLQTHRDILHSLVDTQCVCFDIYGATPEMPYFVSTETLWCPEQREAAGHIFQATASNSQSNFSAAKQRFIRESPNYHTSGKALE